MTMMKKIFRLRVVLCGFAVLLHALSATTLSAKNKIPTKSLTAFFGKRLAGSDEPFAKKHTLRFANVAEARTAVWTAWVEANNVFDEEKLIALEAISETRNGKWKLPEALEKNAVMPYYYGKKGGDSLEAGLPLFLYLHGSGPKEMEWANGLTFAKLFDDGPAIYFVPQIPNVGQLYRWWHQSKQWAWEKLLRQSLVSGAVDSDRIYFFGISEGGYGSQRLASFYADYLAGAGPMAGGEPLKNAPAENCRNIAFSLRTGEKDVFFFRNILTGYTKAALDSLARLYPGDYRHEVELIPERGHSIDYRPTTPWLAKHKRNPYPKHVTWENYEMDGRTRRGFYNLYLTDDPGEGGKRRIRYDMDIEDNTVRLTVREVRYTTIENRQGIDMKFAREYHPVSGGKVRIYLNEELADLSRPVRVIVNDKEVFHGKVRPTLKDLAESCAAFYDPRRLYPTSVEVSIL